MYHLDCSAQDFSGPTLPSNCEMLRYYYHLRQIHTSRYCIRKSVSRCYELWEKAGIPTAPMSYAVAQMKSLVNEHEEIKKMWLHANTDAQLAKEFREKFSVLFFVGTQDAMESCSDNARKLLAASLTMHLPCKVLDTLKTVGEEVNCEKIANVVEDDLKLVEDEYEISFGASGDKAELQIELNNNFDDEDYRKACLFEEEWNERYPNYVETITTTTAEETTIFPTLPRLAFSESRYCIYCCQTVRSSNSGKRIVICDNTVEFTCQECFSVNFARL